ncbi:hypothetical protein F5882DRAFT_376774 [Hyaloscypha sp. PMI_1271]|nr:hypothetical protein F5882DRAFT_376774 [Hyaloscypha sp. PMI_1271]
MDSVSSRITPSTIQSLARPVTRTVLGHGEGIHLVATCLWRSQSAQMSICEVYEWLAEKYPECQYTKDKIRKVLLHDSAREQARFMIANRHRLPGVPCRWKIRPEMEPELRQLCYAPLGRESQVPQSLGDRCYCTEDDQPNETEGRNKTGSDGARSAVAVLRQIPQDNFRKGSLYTKATIVSKEGMVELGRVKINRDGIHNLLSRSIADKLGLSLHSRSILRIRVENYSISVNQYYRFGIQVASVKTTIDIYVVSELPSLLLGKELLDIWRERKAQELRGIVPAFDLVNFEKRRRKRLRLALRERRSKFQMKRVDG